MLSQLGEGDELPNCFFERGVGWVALCLAPYVYALNDLITWRSGRRIPMVRTQRSQSTLRVFGLCPVIMNPT